MTKEEFLDKFHLNLTDQQLTAIESIDRPTLLLAVPGSGKTTVLIARIGYMIFHKNILPENILTITYTVSATADMKKRFEMFFGEDTLNRLQFRTINGLCSLIIRSYEVYKNTKAFDLIDESFKPAAVIKNIYQKYSDDYPNEVSIKEILTAVSYCKNSLLTKAEIEKYNEKIKNFSQIFKEYEAFKIANKVMDYDDQLIYAYKILKTNKPILDYYQNRYKYINVDEAQDTSKIQHKIIEILSKKYQRLFMVGDEDQSIYGFRAAYPQALLEFKNTYENANILLMEQNFRSTVKIVEKANNFIMLNENRYKKSMFTKNEQGDNIELTVLNNYQSQILYLLKIAEKCTTETAVLYRFNESSLPLIDLLEKKKIPYRVKDFDGTFFGGYIVRDILKILSFALDPYNIDLFSEIYYKMGFIITRIMYDKVIKNYSGKNTVLDELISYFDAENPHIQKVINLNYALKMIKTKNTSQALDIVLYKLQYMRYLEINTSDRSKLRILYALARNNPRPDEFLERMNFLSETVKTKKTGNSNFILSSIHSSKALEFEKVILIDIKDGYFPSVKEDTNDSEEKEILEEERRLFYVAVTRAKKHLEIVTYKTDGYNELKLSYFIKDFFYGKQKKINKINTPPTQSKINERINKLNIGSVINHKEFGQGIITAKKNNIVKAVFKGNTEKILDLNILIKNNII